MSLLPPAFKDPAFAPLGPPIKRRATFAQMRRDYAEAQRYNALEDFESENHGNADTGCLQEPCMPSTGKEVLTKESVGRMIVDTGRRLDSINPDLLREIDERNRKSEAWTAGAVKSSPKLESALNAAQAALAEHLFGEVKKVKDPFEKAAAKLRAKDVERAVQMKAKADVMLQQATPYPTWNDALVRKLLEADANRKPVPPSQATDEPAYLRGACREKIAELHKRDATYVASILNLFGAAGLADIKAESLPDLWRELNCPF